MDAAIPLVFMRNQSKSKIEIDEIDGAEMTR